MTDGLTDAEPEVPEAVNPVPVQLDALLLDHVSVADCPVVMEVGDAEKVTDGALGACEAVEHEALAPPFEPVQLHVKGPVPVTLEAVPALQRLLAGALAAVTPFAEPHAPFVGAGVVFGVEGALLEVDVLLEAEVFAEVLLLPGEFEDTAALTSVVVPTTVLSEDKSSADNPSLDVASAIAARVLGPTAP